MSVERPTRQPSDADLLAAAAAGDPDAYATLWTRHKGAARRLAAQLAGPSQVDDLVSEAFARVLRAIRAGAGPESAFRAYLFTTMRRLNIDASRSHHHRVALFGDEQVLDVEPAAAASDVFAAEQEQAAAWRAWQSLPEASRALLWHVVIEGQTPAEVAPLLGVSANGVSSRAKRAKERLRAAFLGEYLALADNEQCRAARAKMGGYVRDTLGARDQAAIQTHLDECERCTAAVIELRDLNSTLPLVIAPILLGGSTIAARYLAATHDAAAALAGAGAATAGAATAGAAGGSAAGGRAAGGRAAALRRARLAPHAGRITQAAAGAAVAAAAGTVVALALTNAGGTGQPPQLAHRTIAASAPSTARTTPTTKTKPDASTAPARIIPTRTTPAARTTTRSPRTTVKTRPHAARPPATRAGTGGHGSASGPATRYWRPTGLRNAIHHAAPRAVHHLRVALGRWAARSKPPPPGHVQAGRSRHHHAR